MAHRITDVMIRITQTLGTPRIDFRISLEVFIKLSFYIGFFYYIEWFIHTNQFICTYLPSLNLVDFQTMLTLCLLAVISAIFKNSLISPAAGLASVALILSSFYKIGCLSQFGTIQLQTDGITVKITFTALLTIVLAIMTLKAFSYTFEIIRKLKLQKVFIVKQATDKIIEASLQPFSRPSGSQRQRNTINIESL